MVTTKKNKINKAASIRQVLQSNRDMSVADVIAKLKAEKISVTPPQVYNARNSMNKMKAKPKNAIASNNGQSHSPLEALLAAKAYVAQCGNIQNAKDNLERVNQYISKCANLSDAVNTITMLEKLTS